jgi:hypothetical protein
VAEGAEEKPHDLLDDVAALNFTPPSLFCCRRFACDCRRRLKQNSRPF